MIRNTPRRAAGARRRQAPAPARLRTGDALQTRSALRSLRAGAERRNPPACDARSQHERPFRAPRKRRIRAEHRLRPGKPGDAWVGALAGALGKRACGRWRLERASPRRRLATAAKAQVKRSLSTAIAEASRCVTPGDRGRSSSAPPPSRGKALARNRRQREADRSHLGHGATPLPHPGNRVGSQRCFALARKTAGRGLRPRSPRLAAPGAARRMAAPPCPGSARPLRRTSQGIAGPAGSACRRRGLGLPRLRQPGPLRTSLRRECRARQDHPSQGAALDTGYCDSLEGGQGIPVQELAPYAGSGPLRRDLAPSARRPSLLSAGRIRRLCTRISNDQRSAPFRS